jgi:PAS domain S-box-containing protein
MSEKEQSSLRASVLMTVLVTLLVMTSFELIKELLFKDSGVWLSHVLTILFATALSGLVGFFVLRVYRRRERQATMVRALIEDRVRKLSMAVEQSPSVVMITDVQGRIEYVNPKFTELTGYALSEVMGMNPRFLKFGDAPGAAYETLWQTITAGRVWRGEFLNAKKSGEPYWGAASISPLRDAGGRITHFIEVMEDVTARKRAEDAQRELSVGLRRVLAMTDELLGCESDDDVYRCAVEMARARFGLERCGIFIQTDGRVRGTYGTNMKGETTDEHAVELPYDERWRERCRVRAPGESRWIVVEEPYREMTERGMQTGGSGWIAITPIQTSQQVAVGVFCNDTAISGAPLDPVKQEVIAVFCTVLGNVVARKHAESERQQVEEQHRKALETADRLSSISLLAAGMAHEVNNPLQGILSHLHLVQRGLPPESPARESLAMVERGVETIAGLVRKLLLLGSSPDMAAGETEANDVIDFVTLLLASQFRKSKIKIVKTKKRPRINVGMTQRDLSQVLLNLLINARDALPEGGTVTVASDADEEECVLRVSDTGPGIPPEIIGRIFTPFFTTKGTKGTGLGLSMAESLVRGAGGAILVDSTPGQGTTFTLRVPLAGPRP